MSHSKTKLTLCPRQACCYKICKPKAKQLLIQYEALDSNLRSRFNSFFPNPGEIFVKQVVGTDVSSGQKYLLFVGERGNEVPSGPNYEAVNFVVSPIDQPNRVIADVTFTGEIHPDTGRFYPGNHYALDGSELLVDDTPVRLLKLILK